jgi:molybdopterin adenylyltransferase
MYRIAILTVSDRSSQGLRDDESGRVVRELVLDALQAEIVDYRVVPDERPAIEGALRGWADSRAADLVLTTGGTGLTSRDVTPEATRAVLDKEAPGIAEALRVTVYPRFPRAALSRGTAGVRGRTLIVNLPGSPGGVRDGLGVLEEFVEHAVELVRGEQTGH